MDKQQLQSLLAAEVKIWATKPFSELVHELSDVVAYERGAGATYHQFEVQVLEREQTCLHVCVSIDDGTLMGALSP